MDEGKIIEMGTHRQLLRKGGAYGVKLKASAPSVHMVRVDIDTEISPMVGDEKQSRELLEALSDETAEKLWQSNIFGKSVEDLVMDGMRNKMNAINDESQEKLQDTMQKIVNDSNGGLVCIII